MVMRLGAPTEGLRMSGSQALSGTSFHGVKDPTGAQKMGRAKALQGLGQDLSDITSDMLRKNDETIAKKSLREFAEGTQTLLKDPSSGYMKTRAQDAQTAYEGTIQKLMGLKNSKLEALNKRQKELINTQIDRSVLDTKDSIDTHLLKESEQFELGEEIATAEAFADIAGASYGEKGALVTQTGIADKYTLARNTAINAAHKIAKLKGFHEGSQQYKDTVQKFTEKINNNTLVSLLDSGKTGEARKVMREAERKGEISPGLALKFGSMISLAENKQVGENAGLKVATRKPAESFDFGESFDSVMQMENAGEDIKKSDVAETKKQYWDGIDAEKIPVKIRPIAFVTARELGKVAGPEQGTAMTKEIIKQAGDDPTAFARLSRDLIERTIADDPNKYQDWAEQASGKINSFEAEATGRRISLKEMRKQILAMKLNPEATKIAIATAEKVAKESKELEDDQYNIIKETAFAKKGRGIEPSIAELAELSAQDRKGVMELDQHGDDPKTLFELNNSPEEWTASNMVKYRNKLTNKTYDAYVQMGLDGPSLEKAKVSNEILNYELDVAGIELDPKDEDDVKKANKLNADIQRAAYFALQSKGRPLNMDEEQKIVSNLVKKYKVEDKSFFGGVFGKTPDQPAFELELADIPPAERKDLVKKFKEMDIYPQSKENPNGYTDRDLIEAYIEKQKEGE